MYKATMMTAMLRTTKDNENISMSSVVEPVTVPVIKTPSHGSSNFNDHQYIRMTPAPSFIYRLRTVEIYEDGAFDGQSPPTSPKRVELQYKIGFYDANSESYKFDSSWEPVERYVSYEATRLMDNLQLKGNF